MKNGYAIILAISVILTSQSTSADPVSSGISLGAGQMAPAGISLDTAWKVKTFEFADKYVVHTAWGLAHSERDYLLAVQLAEMEKLRVDRDILSINGHPISQAQSRR